MQVNWKSHIQKAKSIPGVMATGIRDFFTPNRKKAIRNGAKKLGHIAEKGLDILAHPRRTYRQAPRLGKFAMLTGVLLLGQLGLLQLNKQEQKNKAKDIIRTHILSVDGTAKEKEILKENARLAKRNFTAYIPTLTENQADSLLAMAYLSEAVANSIAYKNMMDIKLFLEENPLEKIPEEWVPLRDSIDTFTQRAQAFGGAAVHNLEEFSKLAKTYVAPEIYMNENGLPVVDLGRNNPVLAGGYELGQQSIDLAENILEITKEAYQEISEWQQRNSLKRSLKREIN